jgi:hypothetical protein
MLSMVRDGRRREQKQLPKIVPIDQNEAGQGERIGDITLK